MTEEEMKWGGGGDTPEFLGKKEKKKPESQSRITLLAEGPQDKNVQR